jgi:predicted dehydrogenase/threonine dehydrogenase-like Zn-dependent dehydrogenase
MKQVAQNYKTGELLLVESPAPACRPGGVLVRTEHSLVSVGTELMKVDESKLSLIGKARARPDKVQQVLQSVAQQGAVSTYRKVTNRLDSLTPLGYSLCGTVIEVGAGVSDLSVGQRVACAGNTYALHAEFNWVPRNLCAPVPDGVSSEHAAFTTVGSIAMHGFRQSGASLGEVACVIGLGLVGQLLVQILTAAGVRVIGVDLAEDRCKLAEEMGAVACGSPEGESVSRLEAEIHTLTGGVGADHVLITAGGNTNGPVELATRLARDRASVVDIGKTRIPWNAWYEKELELRLSRSYGPGRYDHRYEEEGVDYPLPYVRWTEGRNLACFLDLIARRDIDLAPLVSAVAPFAEAAALYEDLRTKQRTGIGFVFRYRDDAPATRRIELPSEPRVQAARPADGVVRVGVIGAGNYATSMILPPLAERGDVRIIEIATSSGLSAANALRHFEAARMSTDHLGLLDDPDIDAVFVLTRHDSHAAIVRDALMAGKAVFVEKPLAVEPDQLDMVLAAVRDSGNDRVMVGYNRRFAPLLTELRAAWGAAAAPQQLVYTVNAGPLTSDSWYRQAAQGARLIGEGCHFVDTASWWFGEDPVDVRATSTGADPDDAVITLRYPGGSVATIVYATGGDGGYPKEQLQVFGGGRVAVLQNFRRLEIWRGGRRRTRRSFTGIDKGQQAEVGAFVDAVASGRPMPIDLDSLVATSRVTFAAVEGLAAVSGRSVPPGDVVWDGG